MGHPTLPEELIEQIVEDLFRVASLHEIFLARGISGEYPFFTCEFSSFRNKSSNQRGPPRSYIASPEK
jgi:hypothetical protein